MANLTLGIDDGAAPKEKTFEQRVAEKLVADFKVGVGDFVKLLERSKNLLWRVNADDPESALRSEAQVQAILAELGPLGPVLFSHHASAREWVESRGLAEFSEEEKLTPYLTKLTEDGKLTTDGPRVVVMDNDAEAEADPAAEGDAETPPAEDPPAEDPPPAEEG